MLSTNIKHMFHFDCLLYDTSILQLQYSMYTMLKFYISAAGKMAGCDMDC